MICKVRYIENQYRKNYPALANRLTQIHNDAWKEITGSKLFRKYGEGDNATYLFSSSGTAQNQKQRNLVERFINKIKRFRRVATRYDKTARNFLSFIHVAAIMTGSSALLVQALHIILNRHG